MLEDTPGIHHVTGIVRDARRNLDFYAGTLGLRPVARTVNFEGAFAYRLSYGDDRGSPRRSSSRCTGGAGPPAGSSGLADEFYRHGAAFVAPQAARSRWYPHSFLAPIERNELHLSAAAGAVSDAVADVRGGVPLDRVVLRGLSQGGCLAAEVAFRRPRRYGGVVASSGGLLGKRVASRAADAGAGEAGR